MRPRPWPPVALLLLACGCASTVTPPAAPADPATIFVIKNGKHVGLIVPRDTGGFVEFGYGDWDWYARDQDRWYHTFDTILWPTAGALGRREIAVADADELRRRTHWLELQPLAVSGTPLRRLRERLDRLVDDRLEQGLYSVRYGLYFVPHDARFWFPHLCADQTAEWLEELGCTISWTPIRTALEVGSPAVTRGAGTP